MSQRNKIVSGMLAVVGGVVLLGLLLSSLQSVPTAPTIPSPTPDVVAVVNGEPISRVEWQTTTALDRLLSQLAGQPLPDAEATLERLINERLVLKLAGAETLGISEADAPQRLAQLQQQWNVDDAALDRALNSIGLTRSDLLVEIKRLLIVEAYLKQIATTQDPNAWLAAQRTKAQVGIYVDLAALSPTPSAPAAAPTLPPDVAAGANPNELAPDFALSDVAGSPVRLSDFRGRPVVLNFWASWCPPCRAEAPALQAAYSRYQERGVALLGIDAQEDAATVQKFASEFGLTYPLLLDLDNAIAAQYQVVGIPTTVFLDAAGVVRARQVGPLTEDQFAAFVDPLLGAAAAPTAEAGLAPDFALQRETGETIRLSDYRGRSSVVLVFYRGYT